jgi:hypothetical protein
MLGDKRDEALAHQVSRSIDKCHRVISKERGLVHFEVFVENNNSNIFLNFM